MPDGPETRTLVVTIDATSIPDAEWQSFKADVNHAVDKVIPAYCHYGAHAVRRSDDVTQLLEEADE